MLPLIYFATVGGMFFLILRLSCGPSVVGRAEADGAITSHRLPIIPLGWALSLFLALSFIICVVFDLILPGYAMYETWAGLLPGFVWLSPGAFLLGLVESFLYGWYVALIFGGLYNAVANRE